MTTRMNANMNVTLFVLLKLHLKCPHSKQSTMCVWPFFIARPVCLFTLSFRSKQRFGRNPEAVHTRHMSHAYFEGYFRPICDCRPIKSLNCIRPESIEKHRWTEDTLLTTCPLDKRLQTQITVRLHCENVAKKNRRRRDKLVRHVCVRCRYPK